VARKPRLSEQLSPISRRLSRPPHSKHERGLRKGWRVKCESFDLDWSRRSPEHYRFGARVVLTRRLRGFFAFPAFISSCGLGGALNIRRAISIVASSRSGLFTAMPRTFTIDVKQEAMLQAAAEFHIAYGNVMARWAQLESTLYWWFVTTTGMSDPMARAIFYGARGFMARAEMLESAAEHTITLSPGYKDLIGEGVKKAKQYSSFRNKVAHGEPRANFVQKEGNTAVHYVITQGKEPPSPSESVLSLQDLCVAAANIGKLTQHLRERHPALLRGETKTPQECLALIRALPNVANSKSTPTPGEPAQSEQEPVRRNKREFRAAQKRTDSPPEGE
jgi:hypothetical protein